FLPQLEFAEVTPWRCPCGCASIDFQIRGMPKAPPGVHPIADFLFGDDKTLSGIFVYEKDGILSGLEVYWLAGDAPTSTPEPESLRPCQEPTVAYPVLHPRAAANSRCIDLPRPRHTPLVASLLAATAIRAIRTSHLLNCFTWRNPN